ncbi:TetR/AcrR family transcriptional regulator [Solicola gregarius]|uniref:TetR/AcrR family transcriptional regulator n=1 Tax=Solicola gregarius TaxID=2908642 RepID=A0AA46YJM9_9ACTN|nr:TetR/AcrR family transcriptional regulator [Solicola gregarius]UYM04755.1 TetR/AcrR family transcriptional regulator [Solicola gregarius]
MTTQPTGLRERKKRQTRESISRHATHLFLQRGFDQVTIAEIAETAQVAKMTVTNYFARKEDLALDLGDTFVSMLANAVRDRRPGESALAALGRTYLAAADAQDPVVGFSGPEFARMITDSPRLVARLREFHDDRERALASALADETGAAQGEVMPRVAAALLAGVHRLLFDETLRRTLDGDDNGSIAAAVTADAEVAFAALEPSLGSYAVRPIS